MDTVYASTTTSEYVGQVEVEEKFEGPLKDRKCRDVIWIIIFTVFVAGMLYGLIYSVQHGDMNRLIVGYDIYGDVCGQENELIQGVNKSGKDLTNKKYLLQNITAINLAAKASTDIVVLGFRQCVEKCPANYTVLLSRCISTHGFPSGAHGLLKKVNFIDFYQDAAEDIEYCWREILYMSVIALGFSVIITLMFRFLAGLVVWLVLALFIIACLAFTTYLWVMWYLEKKDLPETDTPTDDEKKIYVRNLMIYAILSSVATFIVFVILLVLRKRIKLVIALFKEAGKSVHSMPTLLLQPVWTFVFVSIIFTIWLYGMLWIESAGFPLKNKDGSVAYKKDTLLKVARWYHIFGIIWLIQFCLDCQHVVIAGAVSIWYFTRFKSELKIPILTSMWRLIRYHVGSVLFGSVIIALVRFLRFVMKIVEGRLAGRCGKVCNICLKVCQCCLWIFENCLKFLNRNAYIEIAIFGYGFCKAAKQAFEVIVTNAMSMVAINSVGDFVLFLGKAIVVISTVFIGIELVKPKPEVNRLWVPVLLGGVASYIIAHCFISVYEMAIDTIFLCFCEDRQRNDGETKPYFMSKGLMEFVENSSKALANLEKSKKTPNKKETKAFRFMKKKNND